MYNNKHSRIKVWYRDLRLYWYNISVQLYVKSVKLKNTELNWAVWHAAHQGRCEQRMVVPTGLMRLTDPLCTVEETLWGMSDSLVSAGKKRRKKTGEAFTQIYLWANTAMQTMGLGRAGPNPRPLRHPNRAAWQAVCLALGQCGSMWCWYGRSLKKLQGLYWEVGFVTSAHKGQ